MQRFGDTPYDLRNELDHKVVGELGILTVSV